MSERKLATIRRIDDITPIEGADLIHCLHFGGWKVVAQKSMGYRENQLVVFVEIDAWVPHSIAPFLTEAGKEPKVYQGVVGQRLRTKKLKGVISQGLVLPLDILGNTEGISEGSDVTSILGIVKYEPPAEFSSADAKGLFPSFIQKTDQERIQNIKSKFEEYKKNATVFQVTEKLDGSSITIFKKDGVVGVCSRNLELKEDDANTFWKAAKASGIISVLENPALPDIAVQGELIGPGIQGNKYNLRDFEIYVYDIFGIASQQYFEPQTTETLCKAWHGVKHVPVVRHMAIHPDDTIENLLKFADGDSFLNEKTIREGFVFKELNGQESFKIVSNRWLGKFE